MIKLKSLTLLAVFLTQCLTSLLADTESQSIWTPQKGDSWTYQVVVDVKEGSELPADVANQRIEKLDGKLRAFYTQTSVYKGVMEMKEGGAKAHAFYVSNGDVLEQIEYLDIEKTTISARGVKQEGKTPKPVMVLSKSIPLVSLDWKGGEAFPFMMNHVVGDKKVRLVRKFKVLGWETLETKAGKFKALHVQVTGMNGPVELKRSYWFTPRVGFIKEVKKYYLGDEVFFTQRRVLEKYSKKK